MSTIHTRPIAPTHDSLKDWTDFTAPLRGIEHSPIASRLYAATQQVWQEGYEQPFIRELADGSLSRDRFTFYMLQDYLYLADYAKVHALIMSKARDEEIIERMVAIMKAIATERSGVHEIYVQKYGISMEQIRSAKQSAFARAYTSHMLAIAYSRPVLDILVAVLPCAWVYADYGSRLALEQSQMSQSNPYQTWIDMYASDDFWHSASWLIHTIDRLAAHSSEAELNELVDIFVTGVEHEYMFWSSAYDMQLTWKPGWQCR